MNLIKRTAFALLMALAVLFPISSHAADSLALQRYHNCIQACHACVVACESCATSCLNDPQCTTMISCIQLDRDCADVCALTAQLMTRDSVSVTQMCTMCATICQNCADVCSKHKTGHCQLCAEACRKCADECLKLAK
jgi:Domain of Unknown Function (DUF326)